MIYILAKVKVLTIITYRLAEMIKMGIVRVLRPNGRTLWTPPQNLVTKWEGRCNRSIDLHGAYVE